MAVLLAKQDVLLDRCREQRWLLADEPHLRAQPLEPQLPDVHAIEAHLPSRRVVEPLEQSDVSNPNLDNSVTHQ